MTKTNETQILQEKRELITKSETRRCTRDEKEKTQQKEIEEE